MYGIKQDWVLEPRPRHFVLEDYEGAAPRWCSGCGDNAVLSAFLRLARDEQLPPEKTVVVSGIGCSSRFPHYVKTFGFHGLHGRPLPVASGVRSRRPDLNVFVTTGDGDLSAIGTSHWIHAIRYNMKYVVMLLDNSIYGLTKMQTSPTSPKGFNTNTHPYGSLQSPMNPLSVTLGIANASFVAQTVDWNPAHLYATLQTAHRHPGLAFVRVVQRCPHYMTKINDAIRDDPAAVLLLRHESGIAIDDAVAGLFPNQEEHDPSDINRAREIASDQSFLPIGLLYRNENAERYDIPAAKGLGMSPQEKIAALDAEIDKYVI